MLVLGFPSSSVVKGSVCNAGVPGLIPGSGRSAGEGVSYPLQYPWASPVTQLVKNPPAILETWDWPLVWEDPLEKERLPSTVFWPGEYHGLYSIWGHKELDMTEWPLTVDYMLVSGKQHNHSIFIYIAKWLQW